MALLQLSGQLICRSAEERRAVLTHLPEHIRRTLREPGCLYFHVAQTADPMVFSVSEGFAGTEALEFHQTRMARSKWLAATRTIRRNYTVTEAAPEIAPEAPGEEKAIYLLNRDNFGREGEARFIEDLRADGALALSVVAKLGRAYLGHVAFTPMLGGAPRIWALAPVVVRKPCRNQGVGSALVKTALSIARDHGVDGIICPSEQPFFKRFGFTREDARSFESPSSKTGLIALNFRATPMEGRGQSWHPAFEKLA
ncbi:MAG: GNAT family N-acetyltransferase [Paracoccaceae bacterium]|jgi:predicted N-acetyltransferase YhbS